MPAHDVDVLETSGHATRWREDLQDLRDLGLSRVRYPVRWHRVEARPGAFDWDETDRVLSWMRERGMSPIVDLLHHTSYPRWLRDGFADPAFGATFVRYCEEFARRYDDIEEYTLFNEPLATLMLCGHEGIWPPHRRGLPGLLEVFRQVLPALSEAGRVFRGLLPGARHVWVDTCEGHTALDRAAAPYAELCQDRRFFILDLFLGRLDRGERRPFVDALIAAGGEDLLDIEAGSIDALGLDYYAHSEWAYRAAGAPVPAEAAGHELHPPAVVASGNLEIAGITPAPRGAGLAELIGQYAERYEHPLLLTETNLRGTPADRATWLKYTLGQCELARERGARLDGYCWFPAVDSLDWNSLLAEPAGCIDPVGVFWLDEDLERRSSSMLASYRLAAAGVPATDLPAYRFSERTARWLSGLIPAMDGFAWREPPDSEQGFDLERVATRSQVAA